MKVKILIECQVDKAGNLGPLEASAKSPARGGIFLKPGFHRVLTPQAWQMVIDCFDLERLKPKTGSVGIVLDEEKA